MRQISFTKIITRVLLVMLFCASTTFVLADDEWKREISLGYNQSSGNTDNAQLSLVGSISKNTDEYEFLSSIDIYYSSTNDAMDSQKWVGLARYAFNFGEEELWFNSYQVQVDHDYFADIDYRLLPSVGIGYWLFKEEGFKWSLEGSVGYQITKYRSSTPDQEESTFIARTFIEKQVFENASLSEDLSIIPSLEGGSTRIKSETAFTNPINESMDFSVKYIVDHDSQPAEGKKKTDTRVITAVKYSF